MTDDIDEWILTVEPGDAASLDALEAAVWTRVEALGARRRAGRIRIAVVAAALTIGTVNGVALFAARPQPSEMSVFTVSAGLPPLLDRGVAG